MNGPDSDGGPRRGAGTDCRRQGVVYVLDAAGRAEARRWLSPRGGVEFSRGPESSGHQDWVSAAELGNPTRDARIAGMVRALGCAPDRVIEVAAPASDAAAGVMSVGAAEWLEYWPAHRALLDRFRPVFILCIGSSGCRNMLPFLAAVAQATTPSPEALRSADIRRGIWASMTFSLASGHAISPLLLALDDPSRGPASDDACVKLASAAAALSGATSLDLLRRMSVGA